MARFDTKKLHAGYNPADHNYAVSVPIYATAAFELGTVARSDDMFSFDSWDALYSRLSNPTTDVLEARLIELHDATAAVSLASGMAAVTYSLLNITAGGGRILTTPRLYGGALDSLTQVFRESNVEFDFAENPDDPASFEKAIKPDTKVIYIESLTKFFQKLNYDKLRNSNFFLFLQYARYIYVLIVFLNIMKENSKNEKYNKIYKINLLIFLNKKYF